MLDSTNISKNIHLNGKAHVSLVLLGVCPPTGIEVYVPWVTKRGMGFLLVLVLNLNNVI